MLCFSIILIIKDDAALLECALRSIAQIDYPHSSFEVIVVDDGSTDPVSNRISFKPEFSVTYIYIPRDENSCRAKARNLGLSHARFDFLVFMDGDHFVGPSILKNYARYFQYKKNKRLVLGTRRHLMYGHWNNVLNDFQNTKPFVAPEKNTYIDDERIILQQYLKTSFNQLLGRWHLFWTCNFCIEKALLLQVGGFDENFIGWGLEDCELGYRLHHAGYDFEIFDNPIWHFLPQIHMNAEKYYSWIDNIQRFYKKHQDINILHQFTFEDVYFFNSILKTPSTKNWLECYRIFENKIRHRHKVSMISIGN